MFRHTFATMLHSSGVDLKAAQYLMGYATIQMTLDVYTHLDKEHNATATNKLNDFLKKEKEKGKKKAKG